MPGPLLETSALIIGYAMSRLDRAYLRARALKSWNDAFRDAAKRLEVPANSMKNLRDEFDPFHDNPRQGWHARAMYPSRQRVMGQLCDVSDAALIGMVDRILANDPDALADLVEPLSKPDERMHNVAERLRTGRLAEEYFLANAHAITDIAPSLLLDHRTLARGYDFAVSSREKLAIEIKGLKGRRGPILFTDREWTEARARQTDYWLVVIGNLESNPIAKLFPNPSAALDAECRCQTTIAASWQATVAVA